MVDFGRTQRRIVPVASAALEPYAPYGEELPGLTWMPLNFDTASGSGHYLLRFAPGARSRLHEHTHIEEFLVLEGELVEPDGTVFHAGEFVQFAAGTRHFSTAPQGCLLLVILHGRNRPLEKGEAAIKKKASVPA